VTSILPSVVHSEPDHFELYQNYPNPFNPSTTFKYYLPRDADISIKIYSITGQEVESLVEGWVPQGLHEVQWAPRGLASGVYLCEMQGAGEKESRKLIYQK
jgi:hypothetical protein